MSILVPIILLMGQSNMVGSAPYIAARMPKYRVINCALGGTSITEWQKGTYLYNKCLSQVQASQVPEGATVAAVMFYQGEADSYDILIAPRWTELFMSMVNSLRVDLNNPALPIIYAQIGVKPDDRYRPYWDRIYSQQAHLYAPGVYLVKTYNAGAYCPVEGPHFCAAGYKEIARRFVKRFGVSVAPMVVPQ